MLGSNKSIAMSYFAFPKTIFKIIQPIFTIYVKSAAENLERRNAIRNTWGLQAQNLKVPVIFAVGAEIQQISEKSK